MWIDEVYFPNIGSNSVLIHGLDIVPILLQYYFHLTPAGKHITTDDYTEKHYRENTTIRCLRI